MNFAKFESEILSFLNENFENLKRRKVSNSEVAFKDLLITEHKDTNNAIRNIIKKVVSAARADFVNLTDEVKGYELGEQYKKTVKIPQLDLIKVEFHQKASTNLGNSTNQAQQSNQKRIESFQEKSPINKVKKDDAALITGIAATGTIVGAPLLKSLTPLGLGTSLLIVGISAVIISGIVYTIYNMQDEDGHIRQVQVEQPSSRTNAAKQTPIQPLKKTMDKASVDNLLNARKIEAELAVKKSIQHAEMEYNKFIAQLNS